MSKKNPPIRVRLRRSPRRNKKWRAEVLGEKAVDFGQAGASDFTIHKEPDRMLRYLIRHAADMPDSLKLKSKKGSTADDDVVERALRVDSSRRERWGEDDLLRAIQTPGFWSRWLLWSLPDLREAKELIRRKFNVVFVE